MSIKKYLTSTLGFLVVGLVFYFTIKMLYAEQSSNVLTVSQSTLSKPIDFPKPSLTNLLPVGSALKKNSEDNDREDDDD